MVNSIRLRKFFVSSPTFVPFIRVEQPRWENSHLSVPLQYFSEVVRTRLHDSGICFRQSAYVFLQRLNEVSDEGMSRNSADDSIVNKVFPLNSHKALDAV